MSTPSYVRRSVAVLASAGATAALTLVPATGAHAAVAGQYAAVGNAHADFTGSGGGDCPLSSAPGTDEVMSGIKAFSHGTKHVSADLNATFTNTLDSSDKVKVKGHVDSSLTLKKKGRDLSAFNFTVGGSVKVNHTITGSHCRASADVLGETVVQFTEHKKGWLTLTRDTKKPNSVVEFIVSNVKTGEAVAFDVFQGSQSHVTSKALLKPGTYQISPALAGVIVGQGGILLKSQARSTKVAQTIHVQGKFTPKKH